MPWHVEERGSPPGGGLPATQEEGCRGFLGITLVILNSCCLGKAVGPRRPGPAGEARGLGGTTYPAGGQGFSEASGRSAPRPTCPAGSPFLPEMGRKKAEGKPLDPGFMAAHSRSLVLGIVLSDPFEGYSLQYAKADLGRIFEGKYVGKHFCERKVPARCASTPKPSLGGKVPQSYWRMKGAICTQPFPCRKSERLSPVFVDFLLPR